MTESILTLREARTDDLGKIIDYFLKSGPDYLKGMGVDISKLPGRPAWTQMLMEDHARAPEERKFFYPITLLLIKRWESWASSWCANTRPSPAGSTFNNLSTCGG